MNSQTSELLFKVIQRIQKAQDNKQKNIILTPKPHLLDFDPKSLVSKLKELGYKAKISKDGNLDECLRINW